MKNMDLLATALSYMEEHLQEDIRTEDVAGACFCSKSTLEKLFRNVNHISVHDYVIRRRMMKAARMLFENPDVGVLEVALCYGYGTNEAFTRAFKQVWNCKPSEFRKGRRYSELYPRITKPSEDEDIYIRRRKAMDISELYDLFKERKNCYFVCCDIKRLMPINDISRKAGDLAIIEAMKRMNDAAGEHDVVFRIGGDEFALLTDSEDITYAESVAEKIRMHNGEPIVFEEKEIPVALRIGTARFEGPHENVRYDELFAGLHTCIKEVYASEGE